MLLSGFLLYILAVLQEPAPKFPERITLSEAPEYVFGQEHWTYDVESYPNVFTFCILNKHRGISRIFEVSEYLNELDKVYTCLDYLHENDQVMVGFNNLGYDYNILDELLQNRKFFSNKSGLFIAQKLYQKTQEIIEGMRHTGFGSTIPYSDRYVKQLDLFKIWHFDNKAKATSLKMIEFNMREQNIEDLPFPVGSVLTQEQVQILKTYNKHDVNMTDVFREKSKPNIEFRTSLSAKYNRDFSNHNDTKIGKDYFVMRLEEEGIPCYIKENGRRKIRQTKRHWVDIGDCLFDYYDFQEPAFIAVKEWFARQRITETKGVFSDLEEHDLGDVAKYAEFVTKQKKVKSKDDSVADKLRKEHPCGIFVEKTLKATETVKLEDGTKIKRNKTSLYFQWKVAETLNVVVNGFRFDFGVGGIHGSLRSAIVRKEEDTCIVDADV